MGKRRHPNIDNYYECIEKKVRKLNEMLVHAFGQPPPSDSTSTDSDSSDSDSSQPRSRAHGHSSPVQLYIQDVPIHANESAVPMPIEYLPSTSAIIEPQPSKNTTTDLQPSTSATIDPQPSTSKTADPQPSTSAVITPLQQSQSQELNEDLLKILGADPSETKAYGKEIQSDLAIRLNHLATSGLTKEARKELMDRYLPPSNCHLIDAPTLNPEVKAAISEVIYKRDKGIEQKQKQLSAATSCIAEVLTLLLVEATKNTTIIQKLMDASKLLCDTQYSDSLTRRNFVLFNLKKELKDQLQATKIDKMLFSEGLSDALKAAKAISKSGADMKITAPKKNTKKHPKNTPRNLNWRAPPPTQPRQKGNQRTKEPAYRSRPENSSKQSSHRVPSTHHRR